MKQGTQFALPVEIGLDLDDVSRIEFVFKQKNYNGFPAIKSNVWPDDCTRQEDRTSSLSPGRGKKRTNSWAAKRCTWTPASRCGTALTSRRRRFWR